MADDGLRHVFVYGTLRRGEVNDINRLEPAPTWVGLASVRGSLYDLGAYPGLVLEGADPQGHGTVLGEIYRIPAALEAVLDRIEDVAPQPSGEYQRREILASVAGRTLSCLVYELAQDRALGRVRIASGDWVHWRSRSGRR